jgi:DNA (cytosine-5)-methyltransferase 1
MTKYKEWNLNDSIGLLVGGTPCQSFSVAGLRKGLDDPRGNLALTYLGILDKFRPKWCVWENVPGVLSSGGGRDFGSFLGALGELGYGFAYRVLDAQNFGVAQRRRRVFVVGHLGDWKAAAKVLFESESLSGDIKESRVKGKEVAQHTQNSVGALCARDYKGVGSQYVDEGKCIVETIGFENSRRDGVRLYDGKTNTLQAFAGTGGGNGPCVAIQGNLIGRDKGGPQGIGVSDGETMYTLTKADVHGVAFGWQNSASQSMSVDTISPTLDKSKTPAVALSQQPIPEYYAHQYCQDRVYSTEGITPALNCSQAHKFRFDMAVRRLTPVECERLQGFPDNYTNIKDKCPDGPRYKAMGNSMAVPVMRWIGERIQMVENDNS